MSPQPAGLLQQPGVPTDTPPPRRETLTAKQVAPVAGITEQTVYDWVKRGELPGMKIGGKVQIFRKEFCELYRLPEDYDFGSP